MIPYWSVEARHFRLVVEYGGAERDDDGATIVQIRCGEVWIGGLHSYVRMISSPYILSRKYHNMRFSLAHSHLV
jgi:hypothetical protein